MVPSFKAVCSKKWCHFGVLAVIVAAWFSA